jgi:Ferritin-like
MRQGAIRSIERVMPEANELVAMDAATANLAQELAEVVRGVREGGYFLPKGLVPWPSARQAALGLLKVGAEIEHALIIQYLYAAYSLETDPKKFRGPHVPANANELVNGPADKSKEGWHDTIVRIAKEEMGHFITVQNLLAMIGGPAHIDRENFPMHTDLYPFPLSLQPLTRDSLARYVAAEMPRIENPDPELTEIVNRATQGGKYPINPVGIVYAMIYHLFARDGNPTPPWNLPTATMFPKLVGLHLADSDFADPAKIQDFEATIDEWGASDFIHVRDATAGNVIRQKALCVIYELALQGEGAGMTQHPKPKYDETTCPKMTDGPDSQLLETSHYERFRGIYTQLVKYADPRNWIPARDIATDPGLPTQPDTPVDRSRTPIQNTSTQLVARLLDKRYHMLLTDIAHVTYAMRLGSPDTGARALVSDWAVTTEMLVGIKHLAVDLTQRPRRAMGAAATGPEFAGAPFDLPDTSLIPDVLMGRPIGQPLDTDEEQVFWDRHRELIHGSKVLMNRIRVQLKGDPIITNIVDPLQKADDRAKTKIPAG